ncbi:MAG TPA: hypothetical protein VMD30_07980, partial [Tepidisphaeraceae bacterium]|nr:hypothetical protein [Tepidisphaeraceae bacterium]
RSDWTSIFHCSYCRSSRPSMACEIYQILSSGAPPGAKYYWRIGKQLPASFRIRVSGLLISKMQRLCASFLAEFAENTGEMRGLRK